MGNDNAVNNNMNRYDYGNRYIQSDARSQDTDHLINQMKMQYGNNPIQMQSTDRSTNRNLDNINLNNYTNNN